MNRTTTLAVTTAALLSLLIVLPADDALAQQKQQLVFKVGAQNTRYTQQHAIDVGDISGHQIRLFEIRRTYPNNPPVMNGMKIVESWSRGMTDYTNNNGSAITYGVYVLENGDQFYTRGSLVAVQSPGSSNFTATTVGVITSGTGKLAGIQGIVRTVAVADPKEGLNEAEVEIEYLISK
jgi:hypothetical protein